MLEDLREQEHKALEDAVQAFLNGGGKIKKMEVITPHTCLKDPVRFNSSHKWFIESSSVESVQELSEIGF